MGNKRVPRRILHTSDLHLERLGDGACRSLQTMVDFALKAKVDLVIIAGDLFDHDRVEDNLVSFVAEQFRRLSAYVAILPGNHDCLLPSSGLARAALWQDCTNVRLFRSAEGETLDLPGLGMSLWGKAIHSYDADIRPLAGVPRDESQNGWRIAVAHGFYVESEAGFLGSYCITREEIINSRQDYIALGHWPIFRCICETPVKAYYSGSASLSGTVALIDLTEAGVQVTPCSLPKYPPGETKNQG